MRTGHIFRLLAVLLIFSAFTVEGQKVKYKNLVILLNAKKYEEAEPFLRSFMSDPKDAEEPNANLHMARMLQLQAESLDIVNQTDLYNAKIDTALVFYRKSLELIDEKEVKKNDDYYEEYSRRDLRTGKMGVKLSDVHLDIENSVEDLSSRSDRINQMKKSYLKTISFYDGCIRVYDRISKEHESYKQLLLRGRDGIVSEMDSLQIYYDSMIVRRENYFNLREELERYFEKPVWEEREIKQYQIELEQLDLQADLIKTWNFKSWAELNRDLIINETRPLQQSMIEYDKSLAGIEAELVTKPDTLSETEELDLVLVNTLMKYDNDATPIELFNYRLKKIEYLDLQNHYLSLGYLDTADLQIQERTYRSMSEQTKPLDFVYKSIGDYDEDYLNFTYETFLSARYGDIDGLNQYLDEEKGFIEKEQRRWEDSLNAVTERQMYILLNEDRIPLAAGPLDSVMFVKYTPVLSIDSVSGVLTSGWFHADNDSLALYFIGTDGSQVADTIGFAVADSVFQSNYLVTNAIAGYNPLQDDWVLLYFLKNPIDSIFYGTLFRFSKRNLVIWSKQVNLPDLPEAIEYVPESLHFDIWFTSDAGEEPRKISIDTAGNLLQENQ